MRISIILIICAIALGAVSCSDDFGEFESRLEKITKIEDSLDKIIVIPGEGCGGCINNATYYVINNYDRLGSALIIFTGVEDQKLLRNQLGADFLNHPNVLLDSDNHFMDKEVISSYPYILSIRNGSIVTYDVFEENLLE